MSQEGYADPVMNDEPGFRSIIPISELTERVTRAIEASDISSAPLVAKNCGRGNAQNSNRPQPSPTGLRGSRHPNASAAPGSVTLTRPIPRRTRRLDPRIYLVRSPGAPDA